MLSTLQATGNKRYIDWYLDMASKNMTYPVDEILHVQWMNWLITEAQRMSGETWLLDELRTRTAVKLEDMREGGSLTNIVKYPWSKWPTTWDRVYDAKPIVAYVPVLTARRAALGMDEGTSE
jgi:urease accessory protein UreF